MGKQGFPWRFAVTYFSAACVLMVFASLHPGASGRVAVFAAPWSTGSAAQIVARSGGPIISTDATGWIAVSEAANPDFVKQLYRNGAGFVASAAVAACLDLAWGQGNTNERDV